MRPVMRTLGCKYERTRDLGVRGLGYMGFFGFRGQRGLKVSGC